MRVSEEVARPGLALRVVQLLRQHQELLVVGHGVRELAAGGVAVAQVQQDAGLAGGVLWARKGSGEEGWMRWSFQCLRSNIAH